MIGSGARTFVKGFPDAHHVPQEPQGDHRILGDLMLEEQIDKTFPLPQTSPKKQITFGTPIVRIDEGAGLQREVLPIDLLGDFRRELMAKKSSGIHRVAETLLEEFIMRLVNGIFGHGRRLLSNRKMNRYTRTFV